MGTPRAVDLQLLVLRALRARDAQRRRHAEKLERLRELRCPHPPMPTSGEASLAATAALHQHWVQSRGWFGAGWTSDATLAGFLTQALPYADDMEGSVFEDSHVLELVGEAVRSKQCILFLGAGVHAPPPEGSPFRYPPEHCPPIGAALTSVLQ